MHLQFVMVPRYPQGRDIPAPEDWTRTIRKLMCIPLSVHRGEGPYNAALSSTAPKL